MHTVFRKFAEHASAAVGSAWSFILAALVVLVWGISGPVFGFSNTWQLVINTGTTIVTFLMVFLIQNTQNRDSRAIHLKLDELLRGVKGARTRLVDLEDLTDEELDQLQEEFRRLHRTARHAQSGAAAEVADSAEGLAQMVEEEKADRAQEAAST